MPSKSQTTGMRGVYLVAAELSRRGLIACPTSRSARGADILVTDEHCKHACSVQVKTNGTNRNFWNLSDHAKDMVSRTHFYVLVNIKKDGEQVEFFVVPSRRVAQRAGTDRKTKRRTWPYLLRKKVEEFKDRWDLLGKYRAT